MTLLTATRDQLLATVAGLTTGQWHGRPDPDRWTIAEVLEHIVLLEQVFHSRIVPGLKTGPPPAREAATVDALVRVLVPDRNTKYVVPPPLAPTGRWTESDCLREFVEVRQRTIEFLGDPAGFRERTVNHPALGPLDTYQWILMVALHGARHTAQIREALNAIDAPSTAAAAD